MNILIHSDNNLKVSPEYAEKIDAMVGLEISAFAEHLTRVEVYLSDQNAHKTVGNDKRCNIEARLKGLSPIAVTYDADTYDQAIHGASTKLASSIKTIIEKRRNY